MQCVFRMFLLSLHTSRVESGAAVASAQGGGGPLNWHTGRLSPGGRTGGLPPHEAIERQGAQQPVEGFGVALKTGSLKEVKEAEVTALFMLSVDKVKFCLVSRCFSPLF